MCACVCMHVYVLCLCVYVCVHAHVCVCVCVASLVLKPHLRGVGQVDLVGMVMSSLFLGFHEC